MKKYLILSVILSLVIGITTSFFYGRYLNSINGNMGADINKLPPPKSVNEIVGNIVDGKMADYSNKGLTKVPSELLNNNGLVELDISNNSIESLPSEVGRWEKLERFYIANSGVHALPAEIRKWSRLTILDASNNEMTGFPAEIGQLNNLKTLNISNNKIDALPNEIYNLKGLETLDISGNPLSSEKVNSLKQNLPNTTIIF